MADEDCVSISRTIQTVVYCTEIGLSFCAFLLNIAGAIGVAKSSTIPSRTRVLLLNNCIAIAVLALSVAVLAGSDLSTAYNGVMNKAFCFAIRILCSWSVLVLSNTSAGIAAERLWWTTNTSPEAAVSSSMYHSKLLLIAIALWVMPAALLMYPVSIVMPTLIHDYDYDQSIQQAMYTSSSNISTDHFFDNSTYGQQHVCACHDLLSLLGFSNIFSKYLTLVILAHLCLDVPLVVAYMFTLKRSRRQMTLYSESAMPQYSLEYRFLMKQNIKIIPTLTMLAILKSGIVLVTGVLSLTSMDKTLDHTLRTGSAMAVYLAQATFCIFYPTVIIVKNKSIRSVIKALVKLAN